MQSFTHVASREKSCGIFLNSSPIGWKFWAAKFWKFHNFHYFSGIIYDFLPAYDGCKFSTWYAGLSPISTPNNSSLFFIIPVTKWKKISTEIDFIWKVKLASVNTQPGHQYNFLTSEICLGCISESNILLFSYFFSFKDILYYSNQKHMTGTIKEE